MGFFKKKQDAIKKEQEKEEPKEHPKPSAPQEPAPTVTNYDSIGKKEEAVAGAGDTKPEAPPSPLPQKGSIFSNLFPTQTADQPLPELNAREERAHKQLKRLEYVMDNLVQIPGTETRVGIDPIIGFLPVVGDMASAAVSLAFVSRAAPTLSRYTVARMLVNVGIDGVVGAVPIVGDFFDFGFKANTRNMAIFEDHMKRGGQARRELDQKWLWKIVFVFVFVTSMMCIGTTVLFILLIMWLTGNL